MPLNSLSPSLQKIEFCKQIRQSELGNRKGQIREAKGIRSISLLFVGGILSFLNILLEATPLAKWAQIPMSYPSEVWRSERQTEAK